jgi:hypothetical protein
MQLKSIWTIPGMDFAERIRRTRDVLNLKLATMIPQRVLYWAYIRAGSKAMLPDEIVGEQSFIDLLKRMEGTPHS